MRSQELNDSDFDCSSRQLSFMQEVCWMAKEVDWLSKNCFGSGMPVFGSVEEYLRFNGLLSPFGGFDRDSLKINQQTKLVSIGPWQYYEASKIRNKIKTSILLGVCLRLYSSSNNFEWFF